MKAYICYPNGLSKALTMSYDDGKVQDERLIDIFNKYGIKGTFNLNYGILMNEDRSKAKHPRLPIEKINELYQGHEIATHTLTHPTINRCPLPYVAHEILGDRIGLETLSGQIIRGHAYPNGSYSQQIKDLLPGLGIAYARVVETTEDFELPDDLYEWKGTCHHNNPRLLELAKEFADFNKAQYLKLMYVWGHSYEFDDRDNWEVIEEFCKLLGNRSDIWYCTNIEFVDYMTAANNLQFSADCSRVYNPSAKTVYLKISNNETVAVPAGELIKL